MIDSVYRRYLLGSNPLDQRTAHGRPRHARSAILEVTSTIPTGELPAGIGADGMGEVYQARDTRPDRVVAIKIPPSHLSDQRELRRVLTAKRGRLPA